MSHKGEWQAVIRRQKKNKTRQREANGKRERYQFPIFNFSHPVSLVLANLCFLTTDTHQIISYPFQRVFNKWHSFCHSFYWIQRWQVPTSATIQSWGETGLSKRYSKSDFSPQHLTYVSVLKLKRGIFLRKGEDYQHIGRSFSPWNKDGTCFLLN